MRFRVSQDGGETWLPSVQISQQASRYTQSLRIPMRLHVESSTGAMAQPVHASIIADNFIMMGGHTAGLTASTDGIFHALWIGNPTGLAQILTAPVTVRGAGVKNGTSDLASLDDISHQARLDLNLTQSSYDAATKTITVKATVQNISQAALRGPIKVRVVGLRSELGVPRILNSDNGSNGTGAVWDFTPQLKNGTLGPSEVSKEHPLEFELSDMRPFRQDEEHPYGENMKFRWGLISLDVRILGTRQSQ